MIKIFTTEKVKELDQYTIINEPVTSIDLVERASVVFIREFMRRYSKQNRIVVFAGQGNNGADALAISRLLINEEYKVETFLFNPTQYLSPECRENKIRLQDLENAYFTEVTEHFVPPALNEHDIVIDGLFGSGLNRPLTGGFAAVVKYINESDATVVSIDIPSGLFGEDNGSNDPDTIIKANLTLTFGFPKLAFLLSDNEKYVGEWKTLNIGIHPEIIDATKTSYFLTTEEDINKTLKKRSVFAHKGIFGHALLIAGSRGKMGASLLSAEACLRSGAGLVTVHVPSCGEQIIQTAFPEAMLSLDQNSEHFTALPDISAYSAVGIGPGLGQHSESATAFKQLLQTVEKPIVIDADALNLISADSALIPFIPKRSILTPHPKEFDRLAGESGSAYQRLMRAHTFASEYKLCVILKGAYTAICTPEGNIYFNNSGNPGMATAGSGDILTGIILGLLAQGYEPETAAAIGVFIHGTAGDLSLINQSEESLLSGDIIQMLGKAFKQMR